MEIEFEIKGIRPLLMSSPKMMGVESQQKTRRKTDAYDPKEEAETRAYRDVEGYLVVPGRCILACLVSAARLYRARAKGISVANMLKGSVIIDPDDVRITDPNGKHIKDYEILTTRAVIQRKGIMRSRPVIKDWTLNFKVKWNPLLYGLSPKTIIDVMQEAGHIGLLDWRPPYGIFEVTKHEVFEETESEESED